jgi:hypothetical protein
MRNAKLSLRRSEAHDTGPGAITASDSVQAQGTPTRAERLERWREQSTPVRSPEPRPRPCGGYMLGSGN